MAEKDEAAKLAAENEKADATKKENAAAKKKADASEKEDAVSKAKPKKVRVICEGTLGPQLLEKGTVTDDEEYVALLETERGRTLVQEVK